MSERLAIAPARGDSSRRPREVLDLVARWSLPAAPKSLEIRLFWFTRGKGTEDVGVAATERVPAPGPSGERRVNFTLPDAPYSFSGALISLIWAVELVADETAARWEFVLAPEGREILLEPASDAARAR